LATVDLFRFTDYEHVPSVMTEPRQFRQDNEHERRERLRWRRRWATRVPALNEISHHAHVLIGICHLRHVSSTTERVLLRLWHCRCDLFENRAEERRALIAAREEQRLLERGAGFQIAGLERREHGSDALAHRWHHRMIAKSYR
jgi:hypothetical protein